MLRLSYLVRSLSPKLHSSRMSSSLPFGYVYDKRMLEHDCPYDSTMAENPQRMSLIYERLKKDGLLDNAIQIPARLATDDELLLNHPEELLHELEILKTAEECEQYCKDKEILWLGSKSEMAARLAAGSSIDMVKANLDGQIGNAFAIIRPPGHHAHGKLPQGYCVFNNVAVAAKCAVEKFGVKRVAIIDHDYHPANGTFYSMKGDDRYLLVSFHGYHHASFWPYTQDMDYDTPGKQIFFPLNQTMNTEGDYLGAFRHVIMPILKEYKPELILVSGGFDSGYYDIMLTAGQSVKAHGFGHMMKELNDFLPNKVLSFLEGGYFPTNYMESAAMEVKGLLGHRLPNIDHPKRISPGLTETIWNNVIHHSRQFKCMEEKLKELQNQQEKNGLPHYVLPPKIHLGLGVRDLWERVKQLKAVRTREWFPELDTAAIKICDEKIAEYVKNYDWSDPKPPMSDEEALLQLLWDEKAKADCFLAVSKSCLEFVQVTQDFLDGKTDHMMICDHFLIREAEEKLKK